jgi:hypothetical protein
MIESDPLLDEATYLITKFIHDFDTKFKINGSIEKLIKQLDYKHGIERGELLSCLFEIFKKRERHLKYDPSKSSFEIYVAYFTYYSLLNLTIEYKRYLKRFNTISLSHMSEEEIISKPGKSTDYYERQSIEGLIDSVTPEDNIMFKELLEMATDFFGQDDLSVLIDEKDRKAEAKRLEIDYETYRKRLNRKCVKFRSILKANGYFDE